MLKDMIFSTDCLTHRDDFDIYYKNCNIDVKIEDYDGYHEQVIDGTIREDQPYGCRLINQDQWNENSDSIDIYVFGAFEHELSQSYKIHQVKRIYLIGFITKADALEYEFSQFTPANRRLWTPAKIIPNQDLREMKNINTVFECDRNEVIDGNFKERCMELIEKIIEIVELNESK